MAEAGSAACNSDCRSYHSSATGWVTERSIVHAWKACVPKGTGGSNPPPSAPIDPERLTLATPTRIKNLHKKTFAFGREPARDFTERDWRKCSSRRSDVDRDCHNTLRWLISVSLGAQMKIGSIVIRCYEFNKMLAFWREALQYVPREAPEEGWVVLCDPT